MSVQIILGFDSCCIIHSKGFRDLLSIGNQARPRIFDLNIRKPSPLYSDVVEVDERVTLVGFTSDPEQAEHALVFGDNKIEKPYTGPGAHSALDLSKEHVVRGISGEAVHVIVPLKEDRTREDLKKLFDDGYRSIAVVLAHSYVDCQRR
jgi:5-oxoprolinase (ATP-hydrolysing)